MSTTPPDTTRVDAAAILLAAIDSKRGSDGLGIHGRLFAPAGSPTDQLVWIYLTDHRRKKQKRFGHEVVVQQKREMGCVQLGKDGRIWLNKVIPQFANKVARLVRKSIEGVEVLVEGADGNVERKAMTVVMGRGRGDE